MLRKTYKPTSKKVLAVPPLLESQEYETVVEVTDPLTGEFIDKRTEKHSRMVATSESSHVRQESAELYSIQNLQAAGISPVFVAPGVYIKPSLDSVPAAESSAAALQDKLDELESQTKVDISPSVPTTPNVEPSNND